MKEKDELPWKRSGKHGSNPAESLGVSVNHWERARGDEGREEAPFPSCLYVFIAWFQRKQRDRPLAVLAALTAPFAGNWGGTPALKDHLARLVNHTPSCTGFLL